MRFSSVFFTLLFIFSTKASAIITHGTVSDVAVSGQGFELKMSELQKFLEESYSTEVRDIAITWSYSSFIDPSSLFANSIWREVSFTMGSKSKDYRISCSLQINVHHDFIRTRYCTATPDAIVEASLTKSLTQYTNVDRIKAK